LAVFVALNNNQQIVTSMNEQICQYCGAKNEPHTKSCPTTAPFPEGAIISWERGKKAAEGKQMSRVLMSRHSPYFRLGFNRFDVQ